MNEKLGIRATRLFGSLLSRRLHLSRELLNEGLEILNQALVARKKRLKRIGPADRQVALENNAIDTRKGPGYPALVFRKKCIHGSLRFY